MTGPVQPRDFVGYGPTPPHPQWPGGARIAINFVMNYEEGSEYSFLDGDGRSEGNLTDGRMTYANALSWTASLNVHGVTGWRLPEFRTSTIPGTSELSVMYTSVFNSFGSGLMRTVISDSILRRRSSAERITPFRRSFST